MTAEQRDLAASILEALTVIAAGLPTAMASDPENPEVTSSQLAALRFLSLHGTCEMRALAAGAGVTAPTMTSTIKLLVKKGLVERQHDTEDWRKVLITATAAGLAAQRQFAALRAEALASALISLNGEQRAMLLVSLPALRSLATHVASQASHS